MTVVVDDRLIVDASFDRRSLRRRMGAFAAASVASVVIGLIGVGSGRTSGFTMTLAVYSGAVGLVLMCAAVLQPETSLPAGLSPRVCDGAWRRPRPFGGDGDRHERWRRPRE